MVTDYSSTGVVEFLQPLLDEFLTDYPELPLLLRGDSGFAKPELYDQCETNRVSYIIRLKANKVLRELASDIEERLNEATRKDLVSYAVCYGEFMYQAGFWKYPRRVVCKIEKPSSSFAAAVPIKMNSMKHWKTFVSYSQSWNNKHQ